MLNMLHTLRFFLFKIPGEWAVSDSPLSRGARAIEKLDRLRSTLAILSMND